MHLEKSETMNHAGFSITGITGAPGRTVNGKYKKISKVVHGKPVYEKVDDATKQCFFNVNNSWMVGDTKIVKKGGNTGYAYTDATHLASPVGSSAGWKAYDGTTRKWDSMAAVTVTSFIMRKCKDCSAMFAAECNAGCPKSGTVEEKYHPGEWMAFSYVRDEDTSDGWWDCCHDAHSPGCKTRQVAKPVGKHIATPESLQAEKLAAAHAAAAQATATAAIAAAKPALADWTAEYSVVKASVVYDCSSGPGKGKTYEEMVHAKALADAKTKADAEEVEDAKRTAELQAKLEVARAEKESKRKAKEAEKEAKRQVRDVEKKANAKKAVEKAKRVKLEAELARAVADDDDDSLTNTKHNPLYDSESGGEDDAPNRQPPARQPSRGVPQDPKVDVLFDRMDTNNNGKVSKIEFLEFIRAHKPPTGRYSSTAKLQTMFGLERAHEVNRNDFQRVFATYQEDGLQVSLFNVSLGNDTGDDEDGLYDGFSKEEMQEMRDAEYADAIEAANGVVQAAMVEYRSVYTRHLTEVGNIDRRDQFEVVATAIKARCKGPIDGLKVVLLQPDCGVPKSKRALFMMTLRQRFKNHMKRSDSVLMSIVAKANAGYKTGEVKGTERWIEKARIAYGNELRRVTDVERRSVVCVNFDDMLLALRLIDEEFIIIRIKNRFELENAAAKDTAAYRDCQMLCYAKGTELIFEIQLHLECIFQLKSEIALKMGADGRSGHDKYIEFRLLKEIADAEHRRV